MKRLISVLVAGITLLTAALCHAETSQPLSKILTSFDFSVVGLDLNATPEYQAVPKGISSKVDAIFDTGSFDAAEIIAQLPPDYTVRAELSGPGFQTPMALVTKPGKAFDLPSLPILGKYTLSNIRLVDGLGQTLFGAVPQAVAIESISNPLLSSVVVGPLDLDDLKDRGVTFDSSNYTAYQFSAGFATESGQLQLNLPVIIPNSEIVNNDPPEEVAGPPVLDLPPVPDVPHVELPQNLTVSPFLMQMDEQEVVEKYSIPPIPGIVVIPGNIGFLHQYFSALALVTNGAPLQSNLTISNVQVKILLPPGEDLTPGTDAVPVDDPIRMAKGASGFFPRAMTVMSAGPDGKAGTADDVSLLHPAESGQADFTIEGMKEGTHKLDFEITATLEGLPIGPVTLKGKATGAVLVRNPDFSITLGHPSTIRSGEEYDLFVTVTNTGKTIANLVTVSLDPLALSGSVFVDGETSEKTINTIEAGSAVTVKYRLKSQRTGKVTATAFESPQMKGKFILRAGVGELNIPLSPDSLILPYTSDLPPDLLTAAMSLLGQAWSVATAPTGALPADILSITKSIVSSRAFDLSEAGLRIALGDTEIKAMEDLAFDLIGSDNANNGFDNLRRKSSQGVELNRAFGAVFQKEIESSGLFAFQQSFADKVSYRPRHISVVTSSAPVRVRLTDPSGKMTGGLSAGEKRREIPYADQIPLVQTAEDLSSLTLATTVAAGNYQLEVAAEADADFDLGVVVPGEAGIPQQLVFSGVQLSAGAKASISLHPDVAGDYTLAVDQNGDGTPESRITPSSVIPIPDQGPQVVAATQIVPGVGPGGDKHGRNVALLFSQRVTKESAQNLANYAVDANKVSQISFQPGGRMAFLLLRDGIGPFFDRNISVSGLANNAGLVMEGDTRKIVTTAKGPAAVVKGAVRTARGEPVPNATVKLYQLIWFKNAYTTEERYALFSQKQAGADGTFQFDYVLQNDDPPGPFKLETVNPATNEVGSLTTGVAFHGQQLDLDIFMKARGSVSGTVRDGSGNAVAAATVVITTLNDNRSYSTTSDGNGTYSISGISVGAFGLKAVHQPSLSEGRGMGTLPDDGGSAVQDVVIYKVADVEKGNVAGKVVAADGVTPRAGIIVIVDAPKYRNWVRTGTDGSFVFNGVYAGAAQITARDDATGELSVISGVVSNGSTSVFNVIMKGTGTVTGRVERGDGRSVSGLYVIAKVNFIARVLQTDAQGNFAFTGLATGDVSLEVLDPNDFNRTVVTGSVTLFSGGETANVYLYVPEKALATGTIQGTLYSRAGAPLAYAEVRQLVSGLSFYRFKTDGEGRYTIPNLLMGTYNLVGKYGNEIANATATLWYDTQVKTVDLYAAGIGTVTGTTYDDAEKTVPTGAEVTLVSTKPNEVGWLVYEGRFPTVVKSDPSTGRFTFTGIYAGNFTVTSSNIFRPTPVSASGSINQDGQTATVKMSLKGSPPQPGEEPVNQMGSISGSVMMPDGTAAKAGVRVTVKVSDADITVITDAAGTFHFSPIIPSGNKQIIAVDPETTLTWRGYVSVPAGLDVPVGIKLLGRGSLTVRALNSDGTPAPGTSIEVTGSAFPNDSASGATDASGGITFNNLSQGSYAVSASGSFGRGGRGEISIPGDKVAVNLDVRLDPYGTVSGTFLKADGVTPIAGGQIRLKRGGYVIAYTTSSSDAATLGSYRMEYVPLGDFTVDGFDPVTERMGVSGGKLSTDGQTATTDIVVTPQGRVKGSVLNYSGTAPVAGATVNISVSGGASHSYNTVSGADGGFVFTGVPAGRFTIDASDPSNGLRGEGSGTITYEGETAQSEIRIAPTGSIEGKLLMPDGITAAVSGTVSISGGKATQIDPATGGFSFTNLAAGKSYTLTAYEANTLRKGSTIATVTQDGEVAVADIVLRGIGSVEGVVSVDGVALDGARVTITASGASHNVYTQNGGHYRFDNIPAGPFTVKVTHPDPLVGTAASASGSVNSEAELVTVNLTLADVATITGKVLMADGQTASAGGGVKFAGCNRAFTTVTDSSGAFSFENIPLQCSFTLETQDALELGIGKYSGSLAPSEKSKDIGIIVLDDKSISVAGVEPANGSMNVPVTKVLKVLFTEAADPSTVNSSTIYLAKGSTKVQGGLTLDPDQKGVTFTPSTQLSGFSLYTLVVTTGVKDLVGKNMPQNYTASFTTIDNVVPTVVSISPANGSLQVASDGVIRVTFSETIDPATASGIKLLQGGVEVSARIDLIQGGTIAVLTPLEPLSLNASYAVSVSGIVDTVGNPMQGSAQGSFNTQDTIVPTITGITVPANADLIKGNSVLLTAQVADSDVALVDFYVNDVKTHTATTAPYVMLLTLPSEGALHIKAAAQDRVGNRGIPAYLDLNVKADTPPQVVITSPADGATVGTGSSVNVAVLATDDLFAKTVTLTAAGELNTVQTANNVSGKSFGTSFTVIIPAGITGGGTIQLNAVAYDSGGNASPSAALTLTIVDTMAPVAGTVTSAGQATPYKPGESGSATFSFSDNIGITSVSCTATGAASGSETFAIAPAQKQVSQAFSFQVDANASPYAGITVTCSAADAAGNQTPKGINLSVADGVAPWVTGASPADNATNVATTVPISVSFSEPLAAASVTPASVGLTTAGQDVAGTVSLSADRTSVIFTPHSSLAQGGSFTLAIGTTVSDDAGNPLATPYVLTFSTDGAPPDLVSVSPAAASANVPIGTAVSVTLSEPLDPASVTADGMLLSSSFGPVPGTVTLSADAKTVTFRPLGPLGYNRTYTATLSAGVRDESGNMTDADINFSFTTHPASADLAAYWAMDGDWSDSSGNGNDATASGGAGFSPNKVSGTAAGSFDGLNGFVNVPHNDSLNPAPSQTIEFWVNFSTLPSGAKDILQNGIGSGKAQYYIRSNASGGLDFAHLTTGRSYSLLSNSVPYSTSFASLGITAGSWYHIAFVVDDADKKASVYVNGEKKASAGGSAISYAQNASDLTIGGFTWDGYSNVQMDEVSISTRALAPEDILERYHAGLTADRTPPEVPTVDPVTSTTYNSRIVLRGTKDAGSSIRINGKQIVPHDPNTTWQVLHQLGLGQNLLDISSHDFAGNVSPSVNVVVNVLASAAYNPSIIGLWRMNGDWQDASGNGNNGTSVNGAAFASGRDSGTLSGSFDGVNDVVSTPSGYISSAPNTFTMAFWAKPTGTRNVTTEATSGITGGSGQRYAIVPADLRSINAVGAGVSVGTNGISVFELTANYLPSLLVYSAAITGWNHIAVVYENKQPRLYLNGQLVRTGLTSGQSAVYPSATFGDVAGYSPYSGSLENVTIYNRVLTTSEISDLYAGYVGAPQVAISSAGQTVRYRPGETGSATVTASTTSGVAKLSCNVSGAVSEGSLVIPFDPPQSSVTQQVNFRISADAGPYDPLRVSCVAETASGKIGTYNLDLQVEDLVQPVVVGSSIPNNATGVLATLPTSVTFNEAMSLGSFTSDSAKLIRVDTGAAVDAAITLSADGKTATFTPAVALDCSTGYQLLLHGVADVAGNSIDYSLDFTTAPPNSLHITGVGSSSSPYVVPGGDYGNISISSSYVVFSGAVTANIVTLANSSVLSHYLASTTAIYNLDMRASEVSVDATSRIDVSAKGYLGGYQPGNGSSSGRTLANASGSGGGAGGSYGGLGGVSTWSATVNTSYGNVQQPAELGSGGGTVSGGYGGNGGGLVKLTTGSLTLNGSILANGGGGGTYAGGGGSGGGILLTVGTLSGSGSISARGGNNTSDTNAGSGGGGRIAIYYDAITLPIANIVAYGGQTANGNDSARNGGAGTLYLKDNAKAKPDLILNNGGIKAAGTTTIPGGDFGLFDVKGLTITINGNMTSGPDTVITGCTLTLNGAITSSGSLTLDGTNLNVAGTVNVEDILILKNASVLSHYVATTSATYKLDVTASGVSIDGTSKIDVTGKGYLGGYQVGNYSSSGRTVGNASGSNGGVGGSYGGVGGVSAWSTTVNAGYGNVQQPAELGSGGGILLTVGTLSGSGNISARGGNYTNDTNVGSGGGGRIAIHYDTSSLPTANIVASGGQSGNGTSSTRNGGAGTIYLKSSVNAKGDVIINNGGIATSRRTYVPGGDYRIFDVIGGALTTAGGAITSENEIVIADSHLTISGDYSVPRNLTMTNSTLTIAGAATIPGNLLMTGSTLSVRSNLNVTGTIMAQTGSVLTHEAATSSEAWKLDIQSGAIAVDATSRIDASGKGYLGGWQGDNSSEFGKTLGNLTDGASPAFNGGSYGGLGGYLSNAVVNTGYGNIANPHDLGSGGGGGTIADLTGGNGGGFIKIKAPSLTLNGSISADGSDSLYGGGSGGAIRLDVDTISGSGSIRARGGAGGTSGAEGSGGGGGRIALLYTTNNLPAAGILAYGGKGFDGSDPLRNGGAGTVYLEGSAVADVELTIDNNDLDSRDGSTVLQSLGHGTVSILTSTSLTGNGANWIPASLAGTKVNPNTSQEQYFTVIDNTADTLFINPDEGNLNSVAAVGDSYSGVFALNAMKVLGKARVYCGEQIKVVGDLLIDASSLFAGKVDAGSVTTTNGGVFTTP